MPAPPTWSARKFGFDFPVELYPNLLMRLRGTPARMQELLRGADETAVRRRPADGKWSALERAGHLCEVEKLWETRLAEFLAGAETLSPADMTNASTFAADFNAQPVAAVVDSFRAAREAYLSKLDALSLGDFSRSALHPRLQVPMRLVDSMLFAAEHDDHELAWMHELLQHQ